MRRAPPLRPRYAWFDTALCVTGPLYGPNCHVVSMSQADSGADFFLCGIGAYWLVLWVSGGFAGRLVWLCSNGIGDAEWGVPIYRAFLLGLGCWRGGFVLRLLIPFAREQPRGRVVADIRAFQNIILIVVSLANRGEVFPIRAQLWKLSPRLNVVYGLGLSTALLAV